MKFFKWPWLVTIVVSILIFGHLLNYIFTNSGSNITQAYNIILVTITLVPVALLIETASLIGKRRLVKKSLSLLYSRRQFVVHIFLYMQQVKL